MWQTIVGRFSCAVLTTCFAGCSLVQPPDSVVSTEDRPPLVGQPVATLEVLLFNEQGPLPKIDPKELKPRQHVRLITGETPSCDDLDIRDEVLIMSRSFAGTVKANDGERLVLQDVVLINEGRSQTGVPIVNKVPYFSRCFKNTSVARQGISIPGEMALERSKILHACELTDDNFKNIRQNGGDERIGVDFDFNIADGEDAKSTVKEFTADEAAHFEFIVADGLEAKSHQ
ncbi:MAG: hypothetical protein DWI22_15500 [Planctomycetota bacterium]|nr:hypothetical protein [Planctomycetales bacterium]RLT04731.1 MAG: hypothetical protein DWI22_15500 [Planctomycetota bacterium]